MFWRVRCRLSMSDSPHFAFNLFHCCHFNTFFLDNVFFICVANWSASNANGRTGVFLQISSMDSRARIEVRTTSLTAALPPRTRASIITIDYRNYIPSCYINTNTHGCEWGQALLLSTELPTTLIDSNGGSNATEIRFRIQQPSSGRSKHQLISVEYTVPMTLISTTGECSPTTVYTEPVRSVLAWCKVRP